MRMISVLFILTLSTSCAHSIHTVHGNNFNMLNLTREPEVIEARTEQNVVLGFVYNTNYVDDAVKILKNKCQGGDIQGITIQHSTSLGFFSWRNKILVKGLCTK